VRALQLLVVMIYKCSINPVTNPNPESSHYHMTLLCLEFYINLGNIVNYIESLSRRLRAFENMVLRRMCGSRREEVTGDWR
jgi:hypothetical protein